MKKLTNLRVVNRNKLLAQWLTLAGLVLLLFSVFLGFTNEKMVYTALLLTIFGFVISQIGTHFTNRYGGRTRPDEYLNKALKGIDNSTTLYNYVTQINHLMIGPAGVWSLQPRNVRGTITFNKQRNRYRHTGGGLLIAYLKIFGQEGLGNPMVDMETDVKALEKFFKKELGEENIPPVNSALIFTDDYAKVLVDETPYPTMHIKDLKNFMIAEANKKFLSREQIDKITALFDEEIKKTIEYNAVIEAKEKEKKVKK
ncbi:MAG: hypothetical protein JXA19_00835 [Anaerolineales bacterium]|nr:hypothetical protein [Anaerolineales bacterium]